MNTTIIQVPVEVSLRNKALAAFKDMGFSSLQDAIRMYLHKAVAGVIDFKLEEPIRLSPKAARRYDKMIDDAYSGKAQVYESKNVEDLMQQLNGYKRPVPSKFFEELRKKNQK